MPPPPSEVFQKDLGTNWIDSSSSGEFKVKNNAVVFLALFVGMFFWPLIVAFTQGTWGLVGCSIVAITFLIQYFQSICKVKREGDSLVFTLVTGKTKVVPLSNIESMHIGYSPKCGGCHMCCTDGNAIAPYSANVLLTYKNDSDSCCRCKGVVLAFEDAKAFVESLLGADAASELNSGMNMV